MKHSYRIICCLAKSKKMCRHILYCMYPHGVYSLLEFANKIYGNETVHRQDSSPTRFLKTVHRHLWRQFTDTFEDSSPTLLKTVHRQNFILYLYSWSWKNVLILTIKWYNIIWRPVINLHICFWTSIFWEPSKAPYERTLSEDIIWGRNKRKRIKENW